MPGSIFVSPKQNGFRLLPGTTKNNDRDHDPMFFRNLTLFRFAENLPRSLKKLPSALDEHRLRPCGPMELATRGFVSPFGRDSEEMTHQIGAFILTTIGGEDRLLPSVVVNEELAARMAKIAAKDGRRIGAKERKQLKEDVISELL